MTTCRATAPTASTCPDDEPLHAFTAIGTITTGEVHQAEMAPDFKPYRVDVRFQRCEETPLIDALSFIKSKTHWGAAFRFGLLKIAEGDFETIANAMGCPEVATAAA